MGVKEDELVRIGLSGPFDVPELAAVRRSLVALAGTMKRVAGYTGWEGLAAKAASEKMEILSARYYAIEAEVVKLEAAVANANGVRAWALEKAANLPAAQAPSWVHGAMDAFDFPGIPQPVDLAQGGLAVIENFLGGQREKAAAAILAGYADQLEKPRTDALSVRRELDAFADHTGHFEPSDSSGVTPPGGPAGPRYRSSFPPYAPGGGYNPGAGRADDGVIVGVDDPGTGVIPSTTAGSGGAVGAQPGGAGGSGLGGHLAGAGASTALTAGGTAAGLRLGGSAVPAAAGAGARLGTGGLLGAGGVGAPGAASTARSGTATRGGGSGLLGGGAAAGAGGANAGDKKRRAVGKGLGGPMAPKLDDPDEYVAQAPGARAGERTGPDDEADTLDPDA
jgi:hypothetical protein